MPETLPISVLLLARDAAADLEALLPQLGFAREVVIVVDAASDDETRVVAERLGARVFVRPLDGFGPQRAFALAQCCQPWVLWIDSDERLGDGAAASFAEIVRSNLVAGYQLQRQSWFLGRRIRHCGWQNEWVLRLFRREQARFDDAPVHEQVHVEGARATIPIVIEHHSYGSWRDCTTKLVRYARAGAEAARRRGKRASAFDVVMRPPLRFVRMFVVQQGFRDGAHGAVLCALAAVQVFLKYGELWSMRSSTARRESARSGGRRRSAS